MQLLYNMDIEAKKEEMFKTIIWIAKKRSGMLKKQRISDSSLTGKTQKSVGKNLKTSKIKRFLAMLRIA